MPRSMFTFRGNKVLLPDYYELWREMQVSAFQELQNKMISTTQQLKISDAQIETLKRQITHSKLVTKEIGALPQDTRVFQGVGRMFLLQPIPEIQKNLEAKVKASEEKIKTIDTNKGYLERSIKESEDSLRELVLSKKGR